MKIGILKEGKIPPDSRVPLSPTQCKAVLKQFPVDLVVAPSTIRCFTDEAYIKQGITVDDDLSDCDILLGIKEVPVEQLIPHKTYLFFSHTIKKQSYNQALLQSILRKNIRLIDYEVLKYPNGKRVIAFGFFAGVVGAHNALWTYAQRSNTFELPRLKDLPNYNAAKAIYRNLRLPPLRIVVTGTGRVGQGASQTLLDAGIQQVEPKAYFQQRLTGPIFCNLTPEYYVIRKDGNRTDKYDFYKNPSQYKSNFKPFTLTSDIMINGIYWKPGAPPFFTIEEMQDPHFMIKVIADVSCDLSPHGAIPCTLRATTLERPIYGFDPHKNQETNPHQNQVTDIMAIDNLPSELPADASISFGEKLIAEVIPELFKNNSSMLAGATIALDGQLGPQFQYLKDFAG